jgi:hypothetical protein
MQVFIVYAGEAYHEYCIEGVFSSHEKAVEFVQNVLLKKDWYNRYEQYGKNRWGYHTDYIEIESFQVQ